MLKFMNSYAIVAMLALGLVTLFAERAAAQEGRITGTIIDFDGKPWAGLPLKIKSEQGVTQEGKTDDQGKINFSGLKNGKYTLTILAPQLQTRTGWQRLAEHEEVEVVAVSAVSQLIWREEGPAHAISRWSLACSSFG
jgi:hypothetical protein